MTTPPPSEFYPARFGRALKITTLLGSALLLGSSGILFLAPKVRIELRMLLAMLPLVTLAGCWLFSVRGYSLRSGVLDIHRPLWVTELTIRDLQSVQSEPGAWRMHGSISHPLPTFRR